MKMECTSLAVGEDILFFRISYNRKRKDNGRFNSEVQSDIKESYFYVCYNAHF